jgi:hypothetical protein
MSTLYIRNLNGEALPADEELSQVYGIIVPIYNKITDQNIALKEFNDNILGFNVFYDMLIFQLIDAIITAKIDVNYETGDITTIPNDVHIIKIQENMKYVDHYFFPELKKVTLGFLIHCPGLTEHTNQIRPLLYELDLETTNLSIIYNKNAPETDFYYDFDNIGIVNVAALTYDKLRLLYNISFIHEKNNRMYICSINLRQRGNEYEAINTKVIEPI